MISLMLCVRAVVSYSIPICYNLYSRLFSEKVEVEEGPRVCFVKPRLRRLSTASPTSDDSQVSNWRFYGAVLLNEEGVLIDENDSSEEEEESVDSDGAEFWRGGWNGWNTYYD